MIRNWIAVIFVMGCVFHGHVSGKKDNPDPVTPAPVAPTLRPAPEEGQAVSFLFLRKLFRKYGGDGVMTFEGFEHLMENIGLGNVEISDHDVHDHQTKTGFREFHEDHDHNKTAKNHPEDPESPAGERQATKQYPEEKEEEEEEEEELAKNMKKKKKMTKKKKKKEPKQDNSMVLVTGRGGEAIGTRNRRWSSTYVEQKCATPVEILRTFDIEYSAGIRPEEFVSLCPAIVYQLDQQLCHSRHPECHSSSHNHSHAHCPRRHHHHHHGHADDAVVTGHGNHSSTAATTSWKTWLYATLAVSAISLVGLGGVAVIPVMDRIFYNQLLQFLIALAVGTLSGDALVHLLPHAMVPHSHSETPHCAGSSEETDSHKDKDSVWIGFIALMGIVFFFLLERILTIFSARKKRRRRVVQRRNEDEGDAIGLKLCEPMTAQTTTTDEIILSLHENADEDIAVGSRRSQKIFRGSDEFWFRPTPAHHTSNADDEVTHSEGQGHGQGHGHSHVVPKSVTSAAWMVIMGDGLHNFTDGLAIGASFANSLAVGLSTTIAVFCHELPHELGDFAVLLKAGMTIRQALVYNIVSSILCFVGMTIGVWVGKMESATAWIFAATAGIFLYIALVDMIPQLSSPSSSSSSSSSSNNRSYGFRTLVLHGFGVACGLGTMLVIALYEDSIQLAVGDT